MRVALIAFAALFLGAGSDRAFDGGELTVISITEGHPGVPAKTVQLNGEQSDAVAKILARGKMHAAKFPTSYLVNIEYKGQQDVLYVNGHFFNYKGSRYRTKENLEAVFSSLLK
jgi:hypothetical protein